MDTNIPRLAEVAAARCQKGHSGNTRLVRDGKYAQCCGCGTHYTRAQVLALAGLPARDMLAESVRAVLRFRR